MDIMGWIKKLFTPVGAIPPAANRKERRTRMSIARRKRMHYNLPKEDEPTDKGS